MSDSGKAAQKSESGCPDSIRVKEAPYIQVSDMAEYHLHENAWIHRPGLGGLFNGPKFFQLHSANRNGAYFEWEQDGKVVASIHFTEVETGFWRSPARGTYAGLVWLQGLRFEALWHFHEAVLARLRVLGVSRLEILPAPMAHDPTAFATQLYLLRACGYETSQCDLNHSLQVDLRPLAERMSYGNLKRLRKCTREGLVSKILPHTELPEVYDTIVANRVSKGHEMSLSLLQLTAMVESFPEAVKLFGCRMGSELVAAAVCLQLDNRVLYVFYWGDRPGYASLSTVVTLAQAIYVHCQTEGIGLLDVGTSTVDSEPNFGLMQFKEGLGFSASLKVRMTRHI